MSQENKRKIQEMKKQKVAAMLAAAMLVTMMSGCAKKADTGAGTVKLDPEHPVSLTIWHYYNGAQQATFDALVDEFNATEGKDQGIYVEGYSQGSVSDLETAVNSAIKGEVGAKDLPDIFSCYADTAYEALQQDKLADLSKYFSGEETAKYVDAYIQEGHFHNDDALYLFPVAKSTEILMLNKTDWEPFSEETGCTLDELDMIEGVIDVAAKYYDWTDAKTPDVPDDGKAFYGRDSMSNYFILGMKQMGQEIFEAEDGKVTLHTDKELIRRLWDDYYVPYMKGYFASYGKFRSDDVKTGDLIAYTGATSSSVYFPDNVETEDTTYPIEYVIRKAPIMEGCENVQVQQGAGMAVTKSDEEHEYAASVFLKWFTSKEQNIRFIGDSGYMPVLKEANSVDAMDEVIKADDLQVNQKAYDCLKTVMQDFDTTHFYTPKSFENGYSTRKILDYDLSDKAKADKEAVDAAIAAGSTREEALQSYLTDDAFDSWYMSFCEALENESR